MSGCNLAEKLLSIVICTLDLPSLQDKVTVSLTPEHITFNDLNIEEDQFVDCEEGCVALNLILSNKVFMGTTGYFSFGDTPKEPKNSKIVEHGNHISITLPFYKINYSSYIKDIITWVIISKLDEISLNNFMEAFPDISYESIFSKIIGKNYSYIHEVITENNFIVSWYDLYVSLIKYGDTRRFEGVHLAINFKKAYPGLYNKIKGKFSIEDFKKEVSILNQLKDTKLWNYCQTGTLDIVLRYPDVASLHDIKLVVTCMIKDGLLFDTISDESLTLTHIRSHTTIQNFRFFLEDISLNKGTITSILECEPKIIPNRLNIYYNNMKSLLRDYLVRLIN